MGAGASGCEMQMLRKSGQESKAFRLIVLPYFTATPRNAGAAVLQWGSAVLALEDEFHPHSRGPLHPLFALGMCPVPLVLVLSIQSQLVCCQNSTGSALASLSPLCPDPHKGQGTHIHALVWSWQFEKEQGCGRGEVDH